MDYVIGWGLHYTTHTSRINFIEGSSEMECPLLSVSVPSWQIEARTSIWLGVGMPSRMNQ